MIQLGIYFSIHYFLASLDVKMFRMANQQVAVANTAELDCMAMSKLPDQSAKAPIDDAPIKNPTSPDVRNKAIA
jgi:hypothetical protein